LVLLAAVGQGAEIRVPQSIARSPASGNKNHRILLQNNQGTGITYSGTPSVLWFVATAKLVVYPPPYFGYKLLVFMSLQVGLRCKIVITKELFAKSSRIRS
jgi:hypothetical protein